MSNAILSSGLPSTEYYAPNFRVEVDGEELDPETHGDVLDLKVDMDIDNMSSFDLTLNNWDDRTVSFKYSDKTTFDVCRGVHIMMGYADELISMMTGQISTMAPHFPESGASTLTVGGLDGMFRLRDRRPGEGEAIKYRGMADWEIARAVAERNGLKTLLTEQGEVHPEVVQKNQDDAQFLMERAKRIDFDCFVLTDPIARESTLHFVEPTDGRDSSIIRVYQLRWGENLISFNPTINLSHQVGRITVRGWDDRTKQAIVATATPDDLPGNEGNGTSGPAAVGQCMPGKQDVVVDAPVSSEEEALELARSRLRERAYDFITGVGEIIGLPDLRPADNVELSGLGERFNGTYYVKKVTHNIGNNGYRTRFEVRRIFDGGTTT
jgi:phage protein D